MLVRDRVQLLQPLCAERHLRAVFVQQAIAQRLQHTDAAVVRGAAADADDEMTAALGNGVADDLADAVARGVHRIQLRFGDERDARRARHLHDGETALRQDAVQALDRTPEGTRDQNALELAAHADRERLDRALAAVGERTHNDLGLGIGAQHALADGASGLERGQAALERIDCNDNFHGCFSFPIYPYTVRFF